ncbi:MAG TPA: hypothetical protein VL043_06600, partial [Protaetiibacter sp.]|nr:hypothetical protein [Protaetiibacter sp.]
MMRAFVDESERNEEFYFLGALICTPEQQAYITAQLDIVVAKHAREHPAIAGFPELHASTMMNGKRGWGDIPHRLRRGIFEDVL